MAKFTNESMAMKFSLMIDDSKKTVSVSRISSTANATTLDSVAQKFKTLFVVTPTSVKRSSVDLIESE